MAERGTEDTEPAQLARLRGDHDSACCREPCCPACCSLALGRRPGLQMRTGRQARLPTAMCLARPRVVRQKLDLRVDASPTLSESADIRIRHYDVTGRSYNELVRSILANGPKGFHGMASWKPSYTFRTERQERTAESRASSFVSIGEILMPRWIDSAGAPGELVRKV